MNECRRSRFDVFLFPLSPSLFRFLFLLPLPSLIRYPRAPAAAACSSLTKHWIGTDRRFRPPLRYNPSPQSPCSLACNPREKRKWNKKPENGNPHFLFFWVSAYRICSSDEKEKVTARRTTSQSAEREAHEHTHTPPNQIRSSSYCIRMYLVDATSRPPIVIPYRAYSLPYSIPYPTIGAQGNFKPPPKRSVFQGPGTWDLGPWSRHVRPRRTEYSNSNTVPVFPVNIHTPYP